ncbi:MAG: outer membrane lipoprotein-sorting protein [Deltaproteobacteria bacterium]|nr:outer membrane lipoprotein-sorting protein [Deltaproteobacteria bacterium]
MKLARVSVRLAVLTAMALVTVCPTDVLAAKALRPVLGIDNIITSWQEEEVPDHRTPIGVDEIPGAVGVFGYKNEGVGLAIHPRSAGVDTTKPLNSLNIICAKGDELPESGPWNARCYVQFNTSYQGMETKPLLDWVGEFQTDLIDKKGRTRRRRLIQYRKPYYGEEGIRYKNMAYYYEPQSFRGISSFISKPVDETKADDQWVYLPAFRRVRRTPASQKLDFIPGTDVTYDQCDRATGMWDMKIVGEKTLYVDEPPISNCYGSEPHRAYLDGKRCVVIEMTPREKRWPVSRNIIYYDKDSAAPYYEETYSKKGKLERITLPFMAHLYPKNPVYWSFGDLYAHNLRTNHKTIMAIADTDRASQKVVDYTSRDWSNYIFWYDTGLSDEYFSQRFMMRGTR